MLRLSALKFPRSCLVLLAFAGGPALADESASLTQAGTQAFQAGDYATAFNYLSGAAKQGDAEAQFDLAALYLSGKGVQQDPAKAVAWLGKAADQGLPEAERELGFAYDSGIGVTRDESKAIEWLRKAAAQDDEAARLALGAVDAWTCLSTNYRDTDGIFADDEKDVEAYAEDAKKGDARAENNLGCDYQEGHAVQQDPGKAATLFEQAAKQGLAQAQYNLGMAYHQGRGVTRDETRATAWYTKAAAQNLAPAQNNLADADDLGLGTAVDTAGAATLHAAAAAHGLLEAQYNLGIAYLAGMGVAKDAGAAYAWFMLARWKSPDASSVRTAAEQDLEIASRQMDPYQIAAAKKSANHQWKADPDYDGMEVDYNSPEQIAREVQWYRQAAERGDADAQYHLGLIYEAGHGVPIDLAEAYKWLALAVTHLPADAENANVAEREAESVQDELSPEQRAQAQQEIADWSAAHPPQSPP